jgi:hypothetical protein
MYLRDLQIGADHDIVERFRGGFVGWFSTESCAITDLYRYLLRRKMRTPDTAKVHLIFTDIEERAPTLRQWLEVAEGWWLFGFEQYVSKDEAGKKRMIADALYEALLWIADLRGWDARVFHQCHEEALRCDLTLEGWSRRSYPCPNKRYRVRVGCRYELRRVHFYVGVFDRRGREMGRKPLGSVITSGGIGACVMKGTWEWVQPNTFRWKIPGCCDWLLPDFWEVDLSDLIS